MSGVESEESDSSSSESKESQTEQNHKCHLCAKVNLAIHTISLHNVFYRFIFFLPGI